jgi:exopolyphosphatase/guanosine-5'-triphosphate,3'-diphosphate pyrophosphatase
VSQECGPARHVDAVMVTCGDHCDGAGNVTDVRLAVLDIGSNSVHLLVVDAYHGAAPIPMASHKIELRLAERAGSDGSIGDSAAVELESFVRDARDFAEDHGATCLLAFATSALRDAPNGGKVIKRVERVIGVPVETLVGSDEARITFLAARRWFGWSSGSLLLLDIGGGSLEIAQGPDEEPAIALSVPLGAGRMTRLHHIDDLVRAADMKAMRRTARQELSGVLDELLDNDPWQHAVATSKSFKQLARLGGAPATSEGLFVPRLLTREALADVAEQLVGTTAAERATLPGVSPGRARQLPAAAVVAEAVMDLLDIDVLEICPWALREGMILQYLDHLDDVVLRSDDLHPPTSASA